MKIEVDKQYINAEGGVVRVIRNNPKSAYPYICRYYSYTEQGLRLGEKYSSQDLICEVVPKIYEAYISGYILTQKEFIENHIKYWTGYE